ncbi:unnamed protein product [Amoebophrya sp. A120]|nr:unnamed protein product [Amoebophrya sp. A120]|eukprot:GSA120T00000258001.1
MRIFYAAAVVSTSSTTARARVSPFSYNALLPAEQQAGRGGGGGSSSSSYSRNGELAGEEAGRGGAATSGGLLPHLSYNDVYHDTGQSASPGGAAGLERSSGNPVPLLNFNLAGPAPDRQLQHQQDMNLQELSLAQTEATASSREGVFTSSTRTSSQFKNASPGIGGRSSSLSSSELQRPLVGGGTTSSRIMNDASSGSSLSPYYSKDDAEMNRIVQQHQNDGRSAAQLFPPNYSSGFLATSPAGGGGAAAGARELSTRNVISPASRITSARSTTYSPASSGGGPGSQNLVVETTMFAPGSSPEQMSLLQRLEHGSPCDAFTTEDACTGHRTAADSACHWCCGHTCSLDKPGTLCDSWAGLLDSSGYYGRSKNGLGHDSCDLSKAIDRSSGGGPQAAVLDTAAPNAAGGRLRSAPQGLVLLQHAPTCEQFQAEHDCLAHHEKNTPCHWCCDALCYQNGAKCASLEKLLDSSLEPALKSKNAYNYDTCNASGAHALVLTSIQQIPRHVKGYFSSLLGMSVKGKNGGGVDKDKEKADRRAMYNTEIKKRKRKGDPVFGGTCSCGTQTFDVSGTEKNCESLCTGGTMIDGCEDLATSIAYQTGQSSRKHHQKAVCGRTDARDVLIHSVSDNPLPEFWAATCTCDASGNSYTFGGSEDYACGLGHAPPGCMFGSVTAQCARQEVPPVLLQTEDSEKLNTRVLCAKVRDDMDCKDVWVWKSTKFVMLG